MTLSQDKGAPLVGTSWISTLGDYFARYRMALYLVFAAAVSLSVAWNWNWLTAAEVFRITASLPCTFMMLMCMKRAACR
jgi:ABC-type transport system involved in cytochrome bd biosynthesis fused ATPase/permease subunit